MFLEKIFVTDRQSGPPRLQMSKVKGCGGKHTTSDDQLGCCCSVVTEGRCRPISANLRSLVSKRRRPRGHTGSFRHQSGRWCCAGGIIWFFRKLDAVRKYDTALPEDVKRERSVAASNSAKACCAAPRGLKKKRAKVNNLPRTDCDSMSDHSQVCIKSIPSCALPGDTYKLTDTHTTSRMPF